MTRKEWWVPYAFLLPGLAGLLLFRLLPTVYTLGRSLYATEFGFNPQTVFVGADNYRSLFNDPTFWQGVKVTLSYNLIVNPLQTALALLLAILVNRRLPGIGVFRSILVIPIAVSLPVASIIWQLMFDPQSGLLDGILTRVGVPAQPFLTSPNQSLMAIVLIASWIGVGYWMVFILAGLQGIPDTLYEAASIDGASTLGTFMHITLPLLRRVIAFVLIADTAANFLMFAPIYIMTGGGPQGSTDLLMYEAYRSEFIGNDPGRATSITTMLLAALLIVVGMQLAFFRGTERS